MQNSHESALGSWPEGTQIERVVLNYTQHFKRNKNTSAVSSGTTMRAAHHLNRLYSETARSITDKLLISSILYRHYILTRLEL